MTLLGPPHCLKNLLLSSCLAGDATSVCLPHNPSFFSPFSFLLPRFYLSSSLSSSFPHYFLDHHNSPQLCHAHSIHTLEIYHSTNIVAIVLYTLPQHCQLCHGTVYPTTSPPSQLRHYTVYFNGISRITDPQQTVPHCKVLLPRAPSSIHTVG